MNGAMRGLPPPRPIPIKERSSILFLERGRLDILDGAFVLVDENGVRVHIPVGGIVLFDARTRYAGISCSSGAGGARRHIVDLGRLY